MARLVEALSDSFTEDPESRPSWEERKKAYLARLPGEPEDVRLISAADKLYNARAILEDLRECGNSVWDRFKRGRDQQRWYFNELQGIFQSSEGNRLVDEFDRVVKELTALTATPDTCPVL